MKKLKSILLAILFLMALSINQSLNAQPHPNNGSSVGEGNSPVGGGAPIAGGIAVMLLFASGYAAMKYKKREE